MAIAKQTGGSLGTSGTQFTGEYGTVKNVRRTPKIMANHAMWRLMHQLYLARLANRNKEPYPIKKTDNTIHVKKPYPLSITKGSEIIIQPLVETTVPTTIQWWHWPTEWKDEQQTFNLKDLGDGFEQFATQVDIDGFEELGTASYLYGGTPGTGMTPKIALEIQAKALIMNIPGQMNNYVMMHPLDRASLNEELKGNEAATTFQQQVIRQRYKGMLSEYFCHDSVLIPNLVVADAGVSTPLVRGANQDGNSINLDGFDVSKNGDVILKKGQLISFANVKALQPRTKPSTGEAMTFTVTADVLGTANGQVTVPISPELNAGQLTVEDAGGNNISLNAYRNVSQRPADNAVVIIIGTPGKTYRQAIFWQKEALDFINVYLDKPWFCNKYGFAKDPETGIGISVTEAPSILRIDCIYAFKSLRPELAIRAITSEV